MDSLEKFITENRAKFSDHLPSPDVWEGIESGLKEEKEKGFSIVKFLSAGAAAIAILIVGVWFGVNFQLDDMDHAISNSSFTDYRQTEQYYAVQVKDYLQQVKELDVNNTIEDELNQLDEVYQELRDELLNSDVKNQDLIINAMINNYQIKVGMLERILDKTKSRKFIKDINNDYEKVSI